MTSPLDATPAAPDSAPPTDALALPFADPAATVELQFSRDGRLYYVTHLDHHRPRAWVAAAPDTTGKYEVLDFATWSVKSGERRTVPETDPLVGRYALAEGWSVRGSAEWVREALHLRTVYVRQRLDAERTAAFHTREVAGIVERLARYAPHVALPPEPTDPDAPDA